MRTIGQRYELRGELASGGMATVHLARQLGAGGFARIVAVKRLHERLSRDPEFVAMFLDEGRLVARIRHPNVVQTLDVVAEANPDGGNELYIVMEYIHGESLLRLLMAAKKKDEPVPLKIASAIVVGALQGLHEAHEATSEAGTPLGIVHRDVSPHNILVGVDGVARVLDFGVAKASERISSTEEGKVKGKLSYMAPEQLGGAEVDRRTDVYAAGIVLWEILAGQKLFAASNEGALVKMVLDAPVEPPSLRNGAVPNVLDAVIMRSLARDPDDRFATALDFANALAEAIPPATTVEVAAWVRATGAADLEAKTKKIAAIEAKSSAKSNEEAASVLPWAGARPGAASSRKGKTELVPPELAETIKPTPSRDPSRRLLSKTAPLPANFVPPSRPSGGGSTQPPPNEGSGTRTNAALSTRPAPSGRGFLIGGLAVGASLFVVAGVIAVLKLRTPPANTAPAGSAASSSVATPPPPPPVCPADMVFVPGGTFTMGNDDRLDEKPTHKVTLHAFCMDRLEVSVADYRSCSDQGKCLRAPNTNQSPDITAKEKKLYDPLCNAGDGLRDHHPINCIDWKAAEHYCEAQNKRLPAEAEWEYVARGGDSRPFPWGEELPNAKRLNGCGTECVAWQKKSGLPATGVLYSEDDGFAATAPVGSFPNGQSRWGVEDLSGNVMEWVADYSAPYGSADVTDPRGPESGKERVVRGGSFTTTKKDALRSTSRTAVLPVNRHYLIGFRCAKSQQP